MTHQSAGGRQGRAAPLQLFGHPQDFSPGRRDVVRKPAQLLCRSTQFYPVPGLFIASPARA
jgi:hypothetical protein